MNHLGFRLTITFLINLVVGTIVTITIVEGSDASFLYTWFFCYGVIFVALSIHASIKDSKS